MPKPVYFDLLADTFEPNRQVVYKVVDGHELTLHLFAPKGHAPGQTRPCILYAHGGGWEGGSPRLGYPHADYFARRGWLVASLQYRLIVRGDNPSGEVADCVRDGRSAMRYMRQNASELGVDPGCIVAAGDSAGAHIMASTALFDGVDEATDDLTVSPIPRALVLLNPVIDTSPAGYGHKKFNGDWRELSPLHQVRPGLPPTVVFHGTNDATTPYPGAAAFAEAMHAAGNTCVLHTLEGFGHGYFRVDPDAYADTLRHIERFFRELAITPDVR